MKLTEPQRTFLKLVHESGPTGRYAWIGYRPVKKLEELGLVERIRHTSGKMSDHYRITPSGIVEAGK